MNQTIRYLLRGIALAMLVYAGISICYGLFFDPIFQGCSILNVLPFNYKQKNFIRVIYFCVMIVLFRLSRRKKNI